MCFLKSDLTGDKLSMLHIMAWWNQVTNHYLKHWRPRSMAPYHMAPQDHELTYPPSAACIYTPVNWFSIDSGNGLSAPSHYLNQCCRLINWTLSNKFQWNLNLNSNIFIKENAFENIICEMVTILSRGKWVNSLAHGRCGSDYKSIIFKRIIQNSTIGTCC